MTSLIQSNRSLSSVLTARFSKRWLRSLSDSSQIRSSEDESITSNNKPVTRFNKLKSGLILASREDFVSPASRIAIAIRAGSRYETSENSGLTHFLRVGACVSTRDGASAFGIIKNLGRLGASLSVSTTRDYMVYTVECRREQVEDVLPYVFDILHKPAFYPWERFRINDALRRDMALYQSNPQARLIEALHEAAYRGAMARSIYMPPHKIDSRGLQSPDYGPDYNQPFFPTHTTEMAKSFMSRHYTLSNMAVCSVGMAHEYLSELIQVGLPNEPGSVVGKPEARFAGGTEVRLPSGDTLVHTGVVSEGCGIGGKAKEALTLELLARYLTASPSGKHWQARSPLYQAIDQVTDYPAGLTAININHSDTGLFGFHVRGHYREMEKILRTLFTYMLGLSKTGVTGADLSRLKASVKAQLCMEEDEGHDLVLSALVNQSLGTDSAAMSMDEVCRVIDGITEGDLTSALKGLVSSPRGQAMAALGNLDYTPHIHDLLP